jgi:hypothetical protein
MTNCGKVDGEIAHIATEKKYTNLILVPTRLMNFKTVVFNIDTEKNIQHGQIIKISLLA